MPNALHHQTREHGFESDEFLVSLSEHFESCEFKPGQVLLRDRLCIEDCFLVQRGLVTILSDVGDQSLVESALVGPGGLVGISTILGVDSVGYRAVALTECRTTKISSEVLQFELERFPQLRSSLNKYAYFRLAEAMQLSGCNATHRIEQRLSRWILRASDMLGNAPIAITHNALAGLLGVRRASVTEGLHSLESELAIRSRRGRLEVRDRARLEQLACRCYAALKSESVAAFSDACLDG